MTTPTIDQYLTVDKCHAPQWLDHRATRRFHVMAKPAGSACNLDCTYCFYLCPGLKRFFAHAAPTVEKLAAQLRTVPATPQPRM